MERFSNSQKDYWNQIKLELLDSSRLADFNFQYLEIAQLLTHGFSITHYEDKLYLKIWNAEFDNERFSKGIYNLDRLAITESVVELGPEQKQRIDNLMKKELNIVSGDGILLDGLFCQMEFKNKKLVWNFDDEMNTDLFELINIIRSKALYEN